MTYSIAQITTLLHATRHGTAEGNIQFLLTDSRSLCFPEETLFFCIKTDKGDGAAYIPSLIKRGVRHFVVSAATALPAADDVNFLVVSDVRAALQSLAGQHRRRFSCPVVAITGSNGKTVVKEWLYSLLSPDRVVARSPRSYNSQIGVPLSLWLLDETTDVALIETGISAPHEMAALRAIVAPTMGVFTFLGAAHDEHFASRDEKCAEKMSLFRTAEQVVVGGDDERVRRCLTALPPRAEVAAWSRHDAHCRLFVVAEERDESSTTIRYRYDGAAEDDTFTIPFVSAAAVDNALTCALAALLLGIDKATLRLRMALLEPVEMRLNVVEGQHNLTIINDTYNSDINSLQIALDFLHRRQEGSPRQTVVVLSDILQSGVPQETLYRAVGDLLRAHAIDTLIGIGDDICAAAAAGWLALPTTHLFHSVEAFLASSVGASLHDSTVLLKGARQFGFERIEECLVEKVHETRLEVDLNAVAANLSFFRSHLRSGTKLTCMIKANGYGAGAVEIAKTLQENNVDYLAVAVADEGVLLRRQGIQQNIIVMNPERGALKTLFDYSLEPEVYSFPLLDALIDEATREGITAFPCHVKIDTGMRRLGFDAVRDIPLLIERLRRQRAIVPRSVFSHFAAADDAACGAFTQQQFALFDSAARALQQAFSHKILRHICNTAAILSSPAYHLDMCRLGIGLYGINPIDNSVLHPIATLTTVILQIRDVAAGDSVGYGCRGVAQQARRIAAIPIGYADGLSRQVGNGRGYCLVGGQRAKYVGNICMDVSMIDVTGIDCKEGDRVEIFGTALPLTTMAAWCDTIPYEVLTRLSDRVKRVYFKE